MKTNHEIALKAAVDYLKFKLGDRKGFNVYDIDASDADELITEIEQECAKSFMDFLAAVDAERGKDAVPFDMDWPDYHVSAMGCGLEDRNITDRYEAMQYGWDKAIERCSERLPEELFLSPTIPQWIGVEDSLPKEETPVLIIYNGNVVIGERRWEHPTFEDSFKPHWYWDDPTDDGQDWGREGVTHWMPLPPPPAQEGVTK